jgi:hypothetical protein
MDKINRHVSSAFWTAERDRRLKELDADGLSPGRIAARLGATPSAVIRRLYLLRGLPIPDPTLERLRMAATARRDEKERRTQVALDAMRAAIARGVPRDIAIAQARKAGASSRAIGKVVGLTFRSVHRIYLLHY